MRDGYSDQSPESKEKRTRHEAGTLGGTGLHSTFQAMVKSLDLALSSIGSRGKYNRLFLKCCVEGSRAEMGRLTRRLLEDQREDGGG